MPARTALTLFHVRGIRIGVDYSWFLVLFLVIIWLADFYESVLGAGAGTTEPYLLAVVSALAFFASILLHELGHAIVAMRNGIGITDITLWLFGGVARMSRDSDSAGVEFRIAAAGPAVTLAIAAICTAVGIGLAGSEQGFLDAMVVEDGADVSGALAVVAWLASINALVLVFNLIPAFPLDGGRIARAIVWKLTGDRNRATRLAANVGQGFAYVFIALGLLLVLSGDLFTGIWLALIGFLLGSAARGTAARTEVTSRIEGIRVADVMDADPVAIPDDTTVEQALDEFFLRYRWPWFPVTDAAQRFVGLIVRESADAVPEPVRATQRVGEVFEADASGSLQVRTDAPLESLLGNDALRRLGGLAAVDADGTLRGIITAQQVGRALRDALQRPDAASEPPPAA
jgi:Zn-dependent protease